MPEPCSQPNPDCKYFGTPECMMTTHHLYYPAKDYTTRIERFFREMPENKTRLSWCEHQELHATQEPPVKPSEGLMADFILSSEVHIPISIKRQLRRGIGQ